MCRFLFVVKNTHGESQEKQITKRETDHFLKNISEKTRNKTQVSKLVLKPAHTTIKHYLPP